MTPTVVVLDTNVCLDLFVFRDPRWRQIAEDLHSGRLRAVTRPDCRREWEIVLGYPHLPLDIEGRLASAAQFDALIHCLDAPAADDSAQPPRLPICRDPDDQKFLELARQAGAAALITKDKALLKLAKRCLKAGLFAILSPQAWLDSRSTPQEGTPLQ